MYRMGYVCRHDEHLTLRKTINVLCDVNFRLPVQYLTYGIERRGMLAQLLSLVEREKREVTRPLADAGCYVSREYRNFQTALVREISKYAKAVDAAVVAKTKGHYFTSCFVERNGKFVYINHSSGLSRRIGSVRIELDSFLIRTARHAEDYTGGTNQYCDLLRLQSMIDRLLA